MIFPLTQEKSASSREYTGSSVTLSRRGIVSFKTTETASKNKAWMLQGLYDKFEAYEAQKNDEVNKQFRQHGLVKESFNISLKILPRYNGMTVDLNMKDRATENVIFLHGVKEYQELLKFWNYREVSFGEQKVYPHCQTKL